MQKLLPERHGIHCPLLSHGFGLLTHKSTDLRCPLPLATAAVATEAKLAVSTKRVTKRARPLRSAVFTTSGFLYNSPEPWRTRPLGRRLCQSTPNSFHSHLLGHRCGSVWDLVLREKSVLIAKTSSNNKLNKRLRFLQSFLALTGVLKVVVSAAATESYRHQLQNPHEPLPHSRLMQPILVTACRCARRRQC